MFIIQKIEIINKKQFMVAVSNKKDEIFVMYIVTLSINSNVYTSWQAQIFLIDIEEFIISSKYADYTDIFSLNSAAKLLKYTNINNHPINLIDVKQPSYSLIYSLEPDKSKILKTYIKTNLANNFIKSSKSHAGASILFIFKNYGSFQWYVDYWGLNNLIIKN